MKLVLTLGKRWSHHQPVVVVVDDVNVDWVDPDDVFEAANRVGTLQQDTDRFDWDWMVALRKQLDAQDAPSMSVGDTFEKVSDSGEYLGGYAVMMSGWKLLTRSLL